MNITLPDYKNLAKTFFKDNKKNLEIPESKFEDAVLWLRRSRAQYIALNRPSEMGDVVDIDFTTSMNNVPLEGGSGKNHMFILGKGKFVPGFEDRIQGMQVGDERNFSVTVSEDYWLADLRGKTLNFLVRMNNVQKEVLPELNDEFAKSLGTFENLEDITKSIRAGLLTEQDSQETRRLRAGLLDVLVANTPGEIENEVIDRESERILEEFKASLGPNNASFMNYLAQVKKTEEDLKKELHGEAEKNIKVALLLGRIATEEKIDVAEEEVEKKMKEIIEKSKEEQPKEEDLPALKMYVKNMLVAEKTLQFLESTI